jgi:branched-chain amino acid aminotransferase
VHAVTVPAVVFVNGVFLPESDAKISVLDHAVLYGDGAFETAVAWNGRLFHLQEHLQRLWRSLGALAIEPPYPRDHLAELILETVRRNELKSAYVKWLVTRGSNGMPLLDPRGCAAGCIIFARPYLHMTPPDRVEHGLRVKTASVRRSPAEVLDSRIKSLNYLNLVLAKIEATSAGADEALLLDVDGHVCEAPGYNVFVYRDQRLLTPARDILEGVTRSTTISLAASRGLDCSVGTVTLYDVYNATEVLFTSTAGGILAVVEVDGRPIGEGVPGPLYRMLNEDYYALLDSGEYGTAIYGVTASGAH